MKTLQDKFAKELSKNECWDSDGFECYFNLMNGSKAVTILHLQEMMEMMNTALNLTSESSVESYWKNKIKEIEQQLKDLQS